MFTGFHLELNEHSEWETVLRHYTAASLLLFSRVTVLFVGAKLAFGWPRSIADSSGDFFGGELSIA